MGEHFVLEAAGLSKAYGALQVTSDVSLSLSEGEALGVIGPNGAGKTTLFNLLTGTVRADKGRVSFIGADITSVGARKRCRIANTPASSSSASWRITTSHAR